MMKKILIAILLGASLLLSACNGAVDPAQNSDSATDTATGAPTETPTTAPEPPEPTPAEEVKTLTDTDTPDKSKKLTLSYDSYDRLGLQYATGALGNLYDGDINTRLSFYTPDQATSFNVAKLDGAKVIEAVKLFCAIHYERNIGVALQASVDGAAYTTLYTLTAGDAEAMKNGPLVVAVQDSTAYRYFRIYHQDSDTGYDLNEVELYGGDPNQSYFGELIRVTPTFEGADAIGSKYIYGTKPGDPEGFTYLWDNDDATRICYFTWDGGTSFNTAKFAKPTVIAKLRLASNANIARNEGLQIRASVDGEAWTVLYTVTAEDIAELTANKAFEILMPENDTAYRYIQVYHENSKTGYDLTSLDVYSGKNFMDPEDIPDVEPGDGTDDPGTNVRYKRINASYLGFGDGNGGTELKYAYGPQAYKQTEACVKLLWDGIVSGDSYINYYNWENSGSWCSASLPGETVLGKITLTSYGHHYRNKGVAIQASVDGENWVTLYTVSEADAAFVEGSAADWTMRTLDITITDPTAYSYVRVLDTTGGGYCLAEVELYTVVPA